MRYFGNLYSKIKKHVIQYFTAAKFAVPGNRKNKQIHYKEFFSVGNKPGKIPCWVGRFFGHDYGCCFFPPYLVCCIIQRRSIFSYYPCHDILGNGSDHQPGRITNKVYHSSAFPWHNNGCYSGYRKLFFVVNQRLSDIILQNNLYTLSVRLTLFNNFSARFLNPVTDTK